MATKTINTRIKLKYDTFENWQSSTVVLLKGEIACATIPAADPAHKQLPPVMFKVGDGEHTFAQLEWASALAADVYSWAKAANRPAYKYGDADLTGFGSAATKDESAFDAAGSATTAYNNAKEYVDQQIAAIPAAAEYTLETGSTDGSLVLKKDGEVVGNAAVVQGWAALLAKAQKGVDDAAAAQATAEAKYSKPAAGIPKEDLTATVQASLDKADSALQAHQDISGKQDKAVSLEGFTATTVEGAIIEAKKAGTDAQATADAALPKSEFETFKTSNTAAIADAKKAGTDAAAALTAYKTTNDAAVAANTAAISNLETALKSGVTFKGKLDALPAVTDYSNGDLIIVNTKEYICYEEEGTKSWIELGDEGTHLTKATADTYYVPLTREIAGVSLQGNITAEALRTALNVADGATKVEEATVSGWGFTKNVGTVTSVKLNGTANNPVDGVVDLGNVLTEHQDISGKQDKLDADQLAAVNSKITAAKVTKYDGYENTINGKQDAITVDNKLNVSLISGLGAAATKDVTDTVAVEGGVGEKLPTSAAVVNYVASKPGVDKVGTVTSVSAGEGLKVTGTASVAPTIEIDTAMEFILDCGSSTINIE